MSIKNNNDGWTVGTALSYLSRMCRDAERRHNIQVSNLHATIKELDKRLSQRVSYIEKATTAALTTSEQAKLKAETATEHRFAGVNEFRSTLSDQAARFITKSEVELKLETFDSRHSAANATNSERISKLEQIQYESHGKYAQETNKTENNKWLIGIVIGLAVAAVTVIVNLFHH
jgi:hypothetical protein